MGSIGAPELLVILVVALIVLGPTRLPDAARSVGRAMSEFRRMTSGFQAELRDALEPPVIPAEPPPTFDASSVPPPPPPTVVIPPADAAADPSDTPVAADPPDPSDTPIADEPADPPATPGG